MVQKVSRRKDSAVASDRDPGSKRHSQMRKVRLLSVIRKGNDLHEVYIRQVLSIQFDTVDARKVDLILAQNRQKIRHAILMCLVSLFETFPTQGFGCLPS